MLRWRPYNHRKTATGVSVAAPPASLAAVSWRFVVVYIFVFLLFSHVGSYCQGGWIKQDVYALVRVGDVAYAVTAVSINASSTETLLVHGNFLDANVEPLLHADSQYRHHQTGSGGAEDAPAIRGLRNPVSVLDNTLVSIDLMLSRGLPAALQLDNDAGPSLTLRARVTTTGEAVSRASSVEQSLQWGRTPGEIRVILGTAPGGSLSLLSSPASIAAAACHLVNQTQVVMTMRAHGAVSMSAGVHRRSVVAVPGLIGPAASVWKALAGRHARDMGDPRGSGGGGGVGSTGTVQEVGDGILPVVLFAFAVVTIVATSDGPRKGRDDSARLPPTFSSEAAEVKRRTRMARRTVCAIAWGAIVGFLFIPRLWSDVMPTLKQTTFGQRGSHASAHPACKGILRDEPCEGAWLVVAVTAFVSGLMAIISATYPSGSSSLHALGGEGDGGHGLSRSRKRFAMCCSSLARRFRGALPTGMTLSRTVHAVPAWVCLSCILLLESRDVVHHDPKTRAILTLVFAVFAVVATGAEYTIVYVPLQAVVAISIAPVAVFIIQPTVTSPRIFGHLLVLVAGFLPNAIRDLRAHRSRVNASTIARASQMGYI